MAFAVTGTEYIINSSPPVTTYPVTVGAWVRPAATGTFNAVWHLSQTGNDADRFALYQWNTNQWNTLVSVVGADSSCLAGTVTANAWIFVLARWISSANRRIGVLNSNGSTAHAQDTTSAAPTSLAQLTIGAASLGGDPFSGQIAELWYTNTDIQADGAQLQDSTLRQLAYGGPFSVPHIAGDILEYRSFRKHPFLGEAGEVYYGGKAIQTWAPTGTPTIAPHPPLPGSYIKPNAPVPLLKRLLSSGLFDPTGPAVIATLGNPIFRVQRQPWRF